MEFFHVSSTSNRASIATHGLDVSRMGAAPGIAGSRSPEQNGCFLAWNECERDWFVQMNNTGGPVDVWRVRGVDAGRLVTSPQGYSYLPGTIAVEQLTLDDTDIVPGTRPPLGGGRPGRSSATGSTAD